MQFYVFSFQNKNIVGPVANFLKSNLLKTDENHDFVKNKIDSEVDEKHDKTPDLIQDVSEKSSPDDTESFSISEATEKTENSSGVECDTISEGAPKDVPGIPSALPQSCLNSDEINASDVVTILRGESDTFLLIVRHSNVKMIKIKRNSVLTPVRRECFLLADAESPALKTAVPSIL